MYRFLTVRLATVAAISLITLNASALHAALAVPAFSSLPGAHAKLYLHFGGIDYTGTWGGYTPGTVPAYDTDGNTSSFSSTELANIRQIFLRVAEKYSPFNVNVTTVDPGNLRNKETARLIIGGDGSWRTGQDPAAGVAFRGGFYNFQSNDAWVFPEHTGDGFPKYTAEAAAHEAGHLFGLTHQSTFTLQSDGTYKETEYSTNNNNSHRRPVMGSSYGSTRGLWWNGTTSGPNTYQDDLSILSNSNNDFGYRDDDHGDTREFATSLIATQYGTVSATGIIERNGDMDLFAFATGTGRVQFNVALASYGTMLDSTLRLFTGDGTLLQTIATANLAEYFYTDLLAGNYLLGVSGAGGYGDLGQYTLNGFLTPVPEPALAGALGLLALVLRRRR